MQRTRRGLLGVGAAAVVGLSGCLGVEGVVVPRRGRGRPSERGRRRRRWRRWRDRRRRAGRRRRPRTGRERGARDGDRNVVDDAVWFATEYPSAVATYRDAIREVVAEIDDVRDAVDENDAVTVEMADRLDEAGRTAADTAADALEPQFHPDSGSSRARSGTSRSSGRSPPRRCRPLLRGALADAPRLRRRRHRHLRRRGVLPRADPQSAFEPPVVPLPGRRRRASDGVSAARRSWNSASRVVDSRRLRTSRTTTRSMIGTRSRGYRERVRGGPPRGTARAPRTDTALRGPDRGAVRRVCDPPRRRQPTESDVRGWAHELEGVPCTCSGIRTRRPRTIGSTRRSLPPRLKGARRSTPTPPRPDPISRGRDGGGEEARAAGESGSDEGDGEDGEDQAPIYQGPDPLAPPYPHHHEAEGGTGSASTPASSTATSCRPASSWSRPGSRVTRGRNAPAGRDNWRTGGRSSDERKRSRSHGGGVRGRRRRRRARRRRDHRVGGDRARRRGGHRRDRAVRPGVRRAVVPRHHRRRLGHCASARRRPRPPRRVAGVRRERQPRPAGSEGLGALAYGLVVVVVVVASSQGEAATQAHGIADAFGSILTTAVGRRCRRRRGDRRVLGLVTE